MKYVVKKKVSNKRGYYKKSFFKEGTIVKVVGNGWSTNYMNLRKVNMLNMRGTIVGVYAEDSDRVVVKFYTSTEVVLARFLISNLKIVKR